MVLTRARTRVLADGSLTKKASLNALVSVFDFAARIIVGLVVTPLLVSRLGSFMFGVWQFLQRLLGHASVATGRPGEALKWVIAHEQGSTDYDEKRRQVGNAVAVWFVFLPVLLVLGGVLSWFAPDWLHVPADQMTAARLAAAFVVLNFILVSLAYLPQSVLHGENLAYKRLGMSTSLVFVGGALSALAVLLGFGIAAVALSVVVTTILSGLMYLYIARTQVAWFGIARPSVAAVRRFIGLSWWFLLWNFVMQMMRGADVIVLGIAGSAGIVTAYTLTRYIPDAITIAVATVIFAVMPGLGGLVGAGEMKKAVQVRDETMAVTWGLATASGVAVLVWERPFLDLWVGSRYYPGTTAVVLIVVMVLQLALIRTDSNIIDVTLRLQAKTLLGLASAVLSAALGWYLLSVRDLGISGLVAGFVLGRVMLSFAYPWLVGRMLGIEVGRQVVGAVRPGLVTCALLVGGTALGTVAQTSSWLVLTAGAAATTAVAVAVAFGVGLPPGLRRQVVARTRQAAAFR